MKNCSFTSLYIRTDGNPVIGLGHLIRCLALAQMLKNEYNIFFVCKTVPESIRFEIHNKGFQLLLIKEEEEFVKMIGSDVFVVLDGYNFDLSFQEKIRNTGSILVCIDDLQNIEFDADLIINHAPGINAEDYKAQVYTRYALGPEYVLLRPLFLEKIVAENTVATPGTVMICMGGGDSGNLTMVVLQEILQFQQFKEISVVTGAGNPHLNTLHRCLKSDKRVSHYHDISENQMVNLMQKVELSIVPASSLLLEAIAISHKIITGMSAENQRFIYNHYISTPNVTDAGYFSATQLNYAIHNSLKKEFHQIKIFDGQSNVRLLRLFNSINTERKLHFRNASISDLEITYRWASNEIIRANSFVRHKIVKDEHRNWFQSRIHSEKCVYLIAEIDRKAIGSIRFDLNEDEAVVSYLLEPEYHGMGIGQILLNKGVSELKKRVNNRQYACKTIIGYVMKTNVASRKIFENLNYKKTEEENRFKFEMNIEWINH